jgi:hypothetical protein
MSLLTVLFWYISGKNRVFFWECWTHWKAVANALTRTDDDSHTHTHIHTRWERKMNTRARRSLGVRRAATLACARAASKSATRRTRNIMKKSNAIQYLHSMFWSACYNVGFLIRTHIQTHSFIVGYIHRDNICISLETQILQENKTYKWKKCNIDIITTTLYYHYYLITHSFL